jgi:hypothetical protein
MRLSNGLANRQPQADSTAAIGRRGDATIEFLEHTRFTPSGEARTIVRNAEGDSLAFAAGSNLDVAAGRRIADRIFQEVDQDLLQQHAVHVQQRQVAGDFYANNMMLQLLAQASQRRADDFFEHVPLSVEPDLSRLQAGHVQQIVDQAREPLRFFNDGLQQLLPGGGIVAWWTFKQAESGPGDGR